ncbi:MAG: glutathione S-transferase family protein [Pseudomonadota bacterium]
MVALSPKDILTREVLDWKGVHLLHFMGSSCSQKTRIALNLKGVDWTSHHVDLGRHENYEPWFMGINPRGLVPVLVHDGRVIIESNDILEYIERLSPAPALIPRDKAEAMHALLKAEDDLHLDLRALSMRFLFGAAAVRTVEQLAAYSQNGAGTVEGRPDPHKRVELEFFQSMIDNSGITDEQVRISAGRFRSAFEELEERLSDGDYLLGDMVTLMDIAWFIYAARLNATGYPLASLHPRVSAWFDRLDGRAEFHKEVAMPPPLIARRDAMHREFEASGQTLALIGDLSAPEQTTQPITTHSNL